MSPVGGRQDAALAPLKSGVTALDLGALEARKGMPGSK
jgi:hypothetical protein